MRRRVPRPGRDKLVMPPPAIPRPTRLSSLNAAQLAFLAALEPDQRAELDRRNLRDQILDWLELGADPVLKSEAERLAGMGRASRGQLRASL